MAVVTAPVLSATAASTAIIDLRISTFSVVLDASQRRLRQMVAARAIEQIASRQCGEKTQRSPHSAGGRPRKRPQRSARSIRRSGRMLTGRTLHLSF
jgi:hypothetical protein